MSLLVVARELVFLLAVGDGDDVRRFVNPALEISLVSSGGRVWIDGIDASEVARLVVGAVGAVGAVDGVEEGVEDAEVLAAVCDDFVVGLEEREGLRVNEGVGEFEVEVGFAACVVDGDGGGGAVDGFEDGVRAFGDVAGGGVSG